MTQPIKPCPHCGNQPSIARCGDTHWIECLECTENTYLSHADAVNAWNTRSLGTLTEKEFAQRKEWLANFQLETPEIIQVLQQLKEELREEETLDAYIYWLNESCVHIEAIEALAKELCNAMEVMQ